MSSMDQAMEFVLQQMAESVSQAMLVGRQLLTAAARGAAAGAPGRGRGAPGRGAIGGGVGRRNGRGGRGGGQGGRGGVPAVAVDAAPPVAAADGVPAGQGPVVVDYVSTLTNMARANNWVMTFSFTTYNGQEAFFDERNTAICACNGEETIGFAVNKRMAKQSAAMSMIEALRNVN